MASTNRIDSIYDVSAIKEEHDAVKNFVAASIEQIKAAREKSIDFNINTKTFDDYNKKLKELEKNMAAMDKATKASIQASIQLAKAKEAEARAVQANEKAKAQELKTEQEVIKTIQAEERATQSNTKAKQVQEAVVKNLEKEKAKLLKQQQLEEKALQDSTNDYLQLSRAYNDAALKAKNYALALGETHPQTVQAVADAKAMNDTLKRLDGVVGDHRRNVGNYTQATFALTQVLREAPAFANSFATGISAIGNNVPMLIDQFKILRTEVGSGFKAFKILAGSLFSFQALLPIGFLLLQSYAKEIKNFFTNLAAGHDVIANSERLLKKYTDAIDRGRERTNALAESIQFLNTVGKINLEISVGEGFEITDLQAQSVGVATQLATIRNQLQDIAALSDDNFKNFINGAITKEAYDKADIKLTERRQELQGQETKLGREQIILYRTIALERVKTDRERIKKQKDLSEKERKDALDLFKFRMGMLIDEQKAIVQISSGNDKRNARVRQTELEKELIAGIAEFELKEKDITRSKIKLINAKQSADRKEADRNQLLDLMGFVQEEREVLIEGLNKTGDELAAKQKEIDEKQAADLLESQINTITFPFKARIDALEDAAIEELKINADLFKKGKLTKEQYEAKKLEIENAQRKKSLEAEIEYQIQLISISKLPEEEKIKAIERLNAIRKELAKDEIKDAENSAAKQIELVKKTRDAILTLATEVRNLVFDLFTNALERQKNAIQDQIDLLEAQKQKDIEVANQTITNAQDRADAITVIEARAAAKRQQLELKQRQLDQQKARFEKARTVAEIIQSTSLAVVNALTQVKTLGPGAIALAAIIGAIGAVQIARALAQPIPRYAEGTDNHPGGLMVVGDGGKAEGIVLPDGSVYKSPATDTVMSAPPGTKVIPDYATMTKQPVFNVDAVDHTAELRKGFGQVVRAVKNIPQPVIHAERAWTVAHRTGSNFRTYLNRSL